VKHLLEISDESEDFIFIPVGKISQKAVNRSVFLTI